MLGFLKKLLGLEAANRLIAPGTLGLEELARRLGVSERDLQSTGISYSVFHVSKRTGGTRTISAPAAELKAMQRRILHRLLRRLKAHPCATGFERGHSIVSNALPHARQQIIIKLDIRDFFNSIPALRIENFFRAIGWNAEAAALLTQLCTHDGSLPQGAPTSPRLSNLVNYRLDSRLFALAQFRGLAYSRYADDLTFSGSDTNATSAPRINPKTLESLERPAGRINDVIHAAKMILADEGYALHTEKKLRIARRHDRQIVTGLVVNEKVQLPRRTRRRLRAAEHRLRTTGAATLSQQQLRGWRALQNMISVQAAPAP